MAANKPLFIGITGMPGAGKSTVANKGVELGFFPIVLGDVIRREVTKMGLDPTDENCGRFMMNIRQSKGPGIVAALAAKEIPKGKTRITVDGVRSLDEVEVFRSLGNVRVLAVHASPSKRFEYLSRRGRPDDPKTMRDLLARDKRELDIGVGSVVAMADEMLVNTRLTREQLTRDAEDVMVSWLKEDGP